MIILSIETSCDETAIAIVKAEGTILKPKFKVLGEALNSQIKLHEQYGGVFPMMAKREHSKNISPLLAIALKQAKLFSKDKIFKKLPIKKIKAVLEREQGLFEEFENYILPTKKPKIDYIAVTVGPGLEPTLWVGINFAKALGILWGIPVVGINHMEGHLLTPLLLKKEIKYPALALLVSGGHTELIFSKKPMDYKIIGKTRDDAVGEAFDKVARILGLPYPGGPQISKLAEKLRNSPESKLTHFPLPRPMIHSKDFDFSFSGLKTAVLYLTQKLGDLSVGMKMEIAKEFEDSITEVLVSKTKSAIQKFKPKTLILGGGVSANENLRKNFKLLAKSEKTNLLLPDAKLSTDNALMIAVAAYMRIVKSGKLIVKSKKIKAEGNLSL